jgi:hypothetical protein
LVDQFQGATPEELEVRRAKSIAWFCFQHDHELGKQLGKTLLIIRRIAGDGPQVFSFPLLIFCDRVFVVGEVSAIARRR